MKKRITKIIALGLLLGGLATSSAMAEGNIGDTDFYFNWGIIHGKSYTQKRPKYDATSAYMKCIGISEGYDYKARVFVNGIDVTCGKIKTFSEGSAQYIENMAYETYGSGVQVYIEGSTGLVNSSRPKAHGKWSPDSI